MSQIGERFATAFLLSPKGKRFAPRSAAFWRLFFVTKELAGGLFALEIQRKTKYNKVLISPLELCRVRPRNSKFKTESKNKPGEKAYENLFNTYSSSRTDKGQS